MTVGISLGWNCHSASWGVDHGFRGRRAQGYQTCPFDEMVTNYEGVVACIYNKLSDLTDPGLLQLANIPLTSPHNPGDTLIHQKKYKFFFNHESPGHADLYIKEKWPGGKNHYIDNNFALLRERYDRRVANFNRYLHSGERIRFIITHPPGATPELHRALSHTYPNLSYEIMHLDLQDCEITPRAAFYTQKELMFSF